MMQIHLRNVKMHAYHGVYAEEAVNGSPYEINLTATTTVPDSADIALSETVDYTMLYAIVKQHMEQRQALLETVAMQIAQEMLARFGMVHDIEITILKLEPPIPDFAGAVGVTFKISR